MSAEARTGWRPIEEWEGPWTENTLPELFEEYRTLLDQQSLDRFYKKAAREWSIETGVIEGAFDIPRGITTTLIETGIRASLIPKQSNGMSPEQVEAILNDSLEALDGIYSFLKSEQPLTQHYIRSLHQQLMRNVEFRDVFEVDRNSGERRLAKRPLKKGEYKKAPNNPSRPDGIVHEYCPPPRVEEEMARLIELYEKMSAESTPPVVLAAWLHHAFTQIHPFEDGNGRVARALASMVLIKANLPAFTITREMTGRFYIPALEAADQGKAESLLSCFESAIYRQFLLLSKELKPQEPPKVDERSSLEEILLAAEKKLVRTHHGNRFAWEKGHELSQQYFRMGSDELGKLGVKLEQVQRSANIAVGDSVGSGGSASSSFTIAHHLAWGEAALNDLKPETRYTITTLTKEPSARLHLVLDNTYGYTSGFAALYVALQLGSEPQMVGMPYFVNVKDQASSWFDSWLAQRIKEALLLWEKNL